MKRKVIQLYCYLHRTLRYGNSESRLLQFLVIRTRGYLKKYINKNMQVINDLPPQVIELAHAGKMELHTKDYIDRWLYTSADFEPHIVKLFLQILEPGNNVLDIGANIGYFSLIASKRVGANGNVYSFEPSPATMERLKRNIQLNERTNVQLFQKAVSDTEGMVSFQMPADDIKNSGRASFRQLEENSTVTSVETIRLDSKMDEIKPVALVKMDIEGAEAMALKGMTGLIKRDQPVFIMELSGSYLNQLGYSTFFIINFFQEHHYKIFVAGDTCYELDNDTISDEQQYDIVCIPQNSRLLHTIPQIKRNSR
ncbi:MAG: FkbM family methyltransferase [Ferruginibacter sp.]